jgi:Rrf2 family iron-sulfur cluster assembly transcriptional regulator
MGLQLTRGGEYAVRAMMYLGRYPVGHVSSLRDVCREQDVPERFSLARPADEITIRDVVEAIDGPIALNACVLWPEECHRSGDCPMHRVWEQAQERMMSVLDDVTIGELVLPQVPVA